MYCCLEISVGFLGCWWHLISSLFTKSELYINNKVKLLATQVVNILNWNNF